MHDLSFDDAYSLLRTTMPDAEFYDVEKHGETDRYGLPTGQKAATVTCYESRLTNAVRKIGGWIFFIDNQFISQTVQKIAMMWLIHKGGTESGERELMRSLRYCFKRFYSESLVSIAAPPIGRAILLESIVFERKFINEILAFSSDNNDVEAVHFNEKAYEVAKQAILISQRHELGHYLLSVPGEQILDNATKLLDGILVPSIKCLIGEGNSLMAEEVFCDAFALNSLIKTEADYEAVNSGYAYSALHLDEVRAAYFCYTVMMKLSRIWFRSLQDARNGWDPAEQSGKRPDHPRLALDIQAGERAYMVTYAVQQYIRSKGGEIYGGGIDYYYNPRYEQLLDKAGEALDQLSDGDDLSIISEPEREIARFLASTMWLSKSTSQFLIDVARHRELYGWIRESEFIDPVQEPSITTENEAVSNPGHKETAPSAMVFSESLKAVYDSYMNVFDAIVSDIISNGVTQEGTLPRLLSFKDDIFKQIENLGNGEELYESRPLKGYVEKTRFDCQVRILKSHIILLTLIRRSASADNKIPFSEPISERMSCLQDYAIRHQGINVASFASILIPEVISSS